MELSGIKESESERVRIRRERDRERRSEGRWEKERFLPMINFCYCLVTLLFPIQDKRRQSDDFKACHLICLLVPLVVFMEKSSCTFAVT